MRRSLLARLGRLTPLERRLLVRSVVLLFVARLTTWMLPFARARRLVAWFVRTPSSGTYTPVQVRWAVEQAARVVPRATCLPQALAAESLLRRVGLPAVLRIGVRKPQGRTLIAHAWVESDGRIVVGALSRREMAELAPLPPLPDLP